MSNLFWSVTKPSRRHLVYKNQNAFIFSCSPVMGRNCPLVISRRLEALEKTIHLFIIIRSGTPKQLYNYM